MNALTENPVQIITRTMPNPSGDFQVDYPVVTGLEDIGVQQKINSAIITLVNKLITDQGFYSDPAMTMLGWYEIKTNERGILSITIGNYGYHYPAAHGMTINKSLTFDVNTGLQYQLADLFKPGSNYVAVISSIVGAQIKARKVDLLDEFKGIKPDQDFYIADKCLVVYFQLYEISPYAAGFQYFPISVYEIERIIIENGPLGKMAMNI